MRMVQQVVNSTKATYSEIVWDMDAIAEYLITDFLAFMAIGMSLEVI